MSMQIEVDATPALLAISGLEAASRDMKPPLQRFGQYLIKAMTRQMRAAGSARVGGTARGAQWAGMKPQYTRRDGTVVPAWGGVSKVRGAGQVKGRKLKDGSRITSSYKMFSRLKSAGAFVSGTRTVTSTTITLKTRGPAAAQQHAMRQFLFFEPGKDLMALEKQVTRYLERSQYTLARRG